LGIRNPDLSSVMVYLSASHNVKPNLKLLSSVLAAGKETDEISRLCCRVIKKGFHRE
jgi:hypothetical protein